MLTFKKKNQNEPKIDLSVEKLALTNTITLEGLIQVLLKNNVIKQEELLDEIKKMRKHTTVLSDDNNGEEKKG